MISEEILEASIKEIKSDRDHMFKLGICKLKCQILEGGIRNLNVENGVLLKELWYRDEEYDVEIPDDYYRVTLNGSPISKDQAFDLHQMITSTKERINKLELIGFKGVEEQAGLQRVVSLVSRGQFRDWVCELADKVLDSISFYMWLNCEEYAFSTESEQSNDLSWYYVG